MLSNEIKKILENIFSPSIAGGNSKELKAPSFDEAIEFAHLISANSSEEAFQKYLENNPHFLIRSTQFGDDTVLGVLFKPPIGNFYKADFAIVRIGQGAPTITLIEIESPYDVLFTKKMTFAKKLHNAKGQIDDWKEWIHSNRNTFINTTLELLCKSSLYSKEGNSNSFRFCEAKRIMEVWPIFGGDDSCFINYLIVIGRWSNLSSKEQKRMMYINSYDEKGHLQIRTFEQLIRSAFDGPCFF